MKNENTILVTILTESALETLLIKDIEGLGATGYTITNARGKGSQGLRSGAWEATSNIRVEILCEKSVARKIESYLQETYYDNYAMVVFSAAVDVLRPEKFSV